MPREKKKVEEGKEDQKAGYSFKQGLTEKVTFQQRFEGVRKQPVQMSQGEWTPGMVWQQQGGCCGSSRLRGEESRKEWGRITQDLVNPCQFLNFCSELNGKLVKHFEPRLT